MLIQLIYFKYMTAHGKKQHDALLQCRVNDEHSSLNHFHSNLLQSGI